MIDSMPLSQTSPSCQFEPRWGSAGGGCGASEQSCGLPYALLWLPCHVAFPPAGCSVHSCLTIFFDYQQEWAEGQPVNAAPQFYAKDFHWPDPDPKAWVSAANHTGRMRRRGRQLVPWALSYCQQQPCLWVNTEQFGDPTGRPLCDVSLASPLLIACIACMGSLRCLTACLFHRPVRAASLNPDGAVQVEAVACLSNFFAVSTASQCHFGQLFWQRLCV